MATDAYAGGSNQFNEMTPSQTGSQASQKFYSPPGDSDQLFNFLKTHSYAYADGGGGLFYTDTPPPQSYIDHLDSLAAANQSQIDAARAPQYRHDENGAYLYQNEDGSYYTPMDENNVQLAAIGNTAQGLAAQNAMGYGQPIDSTGAVAGRFGKDWLVNPSKPITDTFKLDNNNLKLMAEAEAREIALVMGTAYGAQALGAGGAAAEGGGAAGSGAAAGSAAGEEAALAGGSSVGYGAAGSTAGAAGGGLGSLSASDSAAGDSALGSGESTANLGGGFNSLSPGESAAGDSALQPGQTSANLGGGFDTPLEPASTAPSATDSTSNFLQNQLKSRARSYAVNQVMKALMPSQQMGGVSGGGIGGAFGNGGASGYGGAFGGAPSSQNIMPMFSTAAQNQPGYTAEYANSQNVNKLAQALMKGSSNGNGQPY